VITPVLLVVVAAGDQGGPGGGTECGGVEVIVAEPLLGYVVADSNYDSNKLHQICDELTAQGSFLQLVTRRRYGPEHGTGHRKQTAGRLRSMHLTMLHDREDIERIFGHLTTWGGSLTCLPPWVRTHRRVHRWVQAKLVLSTLKRSLSTTTCALR
jgi:hypothetical protein